MKRFDIITIFPELFEPFRNESLLAKAMEKRLLSVQAHNLRDWAEDKHKAVDDKPFGGGLGMVMKVEPIYKAVKALNSKFPIKSDTFNAEGKKIQPAKSF